MVGKNQNFTAILTLQKERRIYMDNKNLYTMKELCDYLGIGRNTALSLIHEEKLKAFKAGKHWLIPVEEVDAYIKNELKRQSSKPATKKGKVK